MSEPRSFPQTVFAPPPGATQLLLVRHGQSAPFVEGEPFPMRDGHGDPPLSPLGRWQADRVGDRLAEEPFDALYTSTLQRTHQTAAPTAAARGLTPTEVFDLREIHLGEGEGGRFRQMSADDHPAVVEMRRIGDWGAVPGAESKAALVARVSGALGGIRDAHPDGYVGVFVHGGVIGAAMAMACGVDAYGFAGSRNGSFCHLVGLADGSWVVRSFNDASHIGSVTTDHPGAG